MFYNEIRHLGGPYHPFRRLVQGRDLNQRNLGSYKCSEPGGRLGTGRLNICPMM